MSLLDGFAHSDPPALGQGVRPPVGLSQAKLVCQQYRSNFNKARYERCVHQLDELPKPLLFGHHSALLQVRCRELARPNG